MKNRTKQLQFSALTKLEILKRDKGCIFCNQFDTAPRDSNIFDICHVVNKSQGGMGILQNGVVGCRYHHFCMDNGQSAGLRDFAEEYLKKLYPNWTKESVTYDKWGFLNE